MPHRSRLYAAYVDVPESAYERTVRFYADLLSRQPVIDPDEPEYASFDRPPSGDVDVYVQAIGEDTPRVHLDIESDDVEAEVERLVALGATVVDRIHTWVVMRDPVGTVFCVIRVQSAEPFEANATTWS